MIPVLPSTAWREFRGQPKGLGNNRTVHLATIEGPDGQLHRCYVKIVPNGWPTILTESIAWLLAEALDLPRPAFAAVVFVPLQKLRGCMQLDQHWLHYSEPPGFCSEAVEGKALAQTWKSHPSMNLRAALARPEIRRISAFDEWVDNRDRHFGNVLRRSDGTCVPIDNEFILFSTIWAHLMPTVNVAHHSLLSAATTALPAPGLLRFKVDAALAGDRHAAALAKVQQSLVQTITALLGHPVIGPQLAATVCSFLQQRGEQQWMRTHLGVIA